MENTTVELASIQLAIEKAKTDQEKQLMELQLALVGGGAGDVVFA